MMQQAPTLARRNTIVFFFVLFVLLLGARLCHLDILWADEDYHQAVAVEVLHGNALYRDVWYDKPPLSALTYLLFGAQGGWLLRLASAIFATLTAAVAFVFASECWTRKEGYWAAGLTAFFLIFYFPGATLTLEPDTLMLLPHFLAIYLAWKRRAFMAGISAGIAMLLNVKAGFVLAACVVFAWPAALPLVGGFLLPNFLFAAWLWSSGAFGDYIDQVWRWGFLYSASPETIGAGVSRVVNWFGFHAALVAGASCFFWRWAKDRTPWGMWLLFSLVAAGIGWRFLPRYMDQLLPPLVVLGANGLSHLWSEKRRTATVLIGAGLLIPLVRFGPRYVILASELLAHKPHDWRDVALDLDSQAAAKIIEQRARPGDTIFVWGYRPNVVAYTRLPVAAKFWDSQALTGVPADRHLYSSKSIAADWAQANRRQVIRSKPTFIADGLGLLNPDLQMQKFPELAQWLNAYCMVGRTEETIVYQRCRD